MIYRVSPTPFLSQKCSHSAEMNGQIFDQTDKACTKTLTLQERMLTLKHSISQGQIYGLTLEKSRSTLQQRISPKLSLFYYIIKSDKISTPNKARPAATGQCYLCIGPALGGRSMPMLASHPNPNDAKHSQQSKSNIAHFLWQDEVLCCKFTSTITSFFWSFFF